ncbi:hypothetical protein JKF63_06099 [Porcisia hertigi]|uniref:Uncharacterized protein n=1 Tax=Porcisia hertigi TaxID=2761500 RepID=A0A836LEB4_9TRYP|nr:hypothetical protein JKF63_06099 [Porcisia hertigi]
MCAVPQYTGCFTLLYADPEVKDQHQYLQPLYGLTADDDPPAPLQNHGDLSHDALGCASSNSCSLTSQDGLQSSISGSQRVVSLSDPGLQRHKRPCTTSSVIPRSSHLPDPKDEEGSDGQPAPAATTGLTLARPPRRIDHVGLSLYPDLSTDIVGPQPVFGGAAISPTNSINSSPAAQTGGVPGPYLFASNGVPLLSSVVDAAALEQLRDARRPYPAPKPRSGHVLLSCPERGSLIMFGGLGNVPFNDVWEYDVRTGRWAELRCVPAQEEEDQLALQQQQQRRSPAQHSDLHPTAPDDEDEDATTTSRGSVNDDASDDDDNTEDSPQGLRWSPQRRHIVPPPAYGQAASLYRDSNGETCMAVLGGISVGDICCSGLFSLNLNRLTWRCMETTIPFWGMWGATAQTLYAPRRSTVPYAARGDAKDTEGNDCRVSAEEEVVVLFGGMTEDGHVVRPLTHLFHFDHRLTAAEIEADPDMYLNSIQYKKKENARILRQLFGEANTPGPLITSDDMIPPSLQMRCDEWRAAHPDTVAQWRRRALDKMVGKYWAECIPSPGDLHGRRRSTSAAYKRHFMFIFGGRDDSYFYNDLWCLNLITRTWVQLREGVPPHLLRSFLAEPRNPLHGLRIGSVLVNLRRETREKIEAKVLRSSPNGTIDRIHFSRDVHHALFASSVNSTARARTGACMVADVQRDCLYVYGGFFYTGQQHLTFFDLHAFYISENVWRRVCICRERRWAAELDAAADAVSIVHPTEEGRAYARHASPSPSAGAGGQMARSGASSLPSTLMGYATRYLKGTPSATASTSTTPVAASPGLPLAPRGSRAARMPRGDSDPSACGNLFHLPVLVPEARTMAAMVDDPVHPGARFFLHGGRSGEEASGDFFELRTYVSRTVDKEYTKLHRAAEEEEVAVAAAASGLDTRRHLASLNTWTPSSASSRSSPAASIGTASLAVADAPRAQGLGMSAADVARLQWRSRRRLQRQLVSAALEAQEGFEDMPAAHYSSINDTAPLPRRTLLDAATHWVRDGLAAIDPESLMLVELRNGYAVVNLPTHIHYLSRLGPAGSSSSSGGGGNRRSSDESRTTVSGERTSTVEAPTVSALDTLMGSNPIEKRNAKLRRSAQSMELLLYHVLLSKPVNSNSSGADGGGVCGRGGRADNLKRCPYCTCSTPQVPGHEALWSLCPRLITMETSPEASGTLPTHPVDFALGSPGSGTPHSTSRPLQTLSVTLPGTNASPTQQHRLTTTPVVQQIGDPTVMSENDARTSLPPLASGNSSLCGVGGSGLASSVSTCSVADGGAHLANNEYAHHVLLRSLFCREPFYKASQRINQKR